MCMDNRVLEDGSLRARMDAIRPFTAALDEIQDHVVVTDPDGHVLYMNPAARRLTGYSLEQVLGRNPGDIWGGRMEQDFYERMWHRIKVEKLPFTGELKNMNAAGKEYWQELRISPVLDAGGDIEHFIAIEPDITERKQEERSRKEAMSVIGHESLSPATAVRWLLELVLERGGMDAQESAQLKEAYRENTRLIDLLRDMIVLSGEGEAHPRQENIDLHTVLENAVAAARLKYPDVRMRSELHPVPALRGVASVAERLTELLLRRAARLPAHAGGELSVSLDDRGGRPVLAVEADLPGDAGQDSLRDKLIIVLAAALHADEPVIRRDAGHERIEISFPAS